MKPKMIHAMLKKSKIKNKRKQNTNKQTTKTKNFLKQKIKMKDGKHKLKIDSEK